MGQARDFQSKMWPSPRASGAFTADDSASANPNAGGNGLVITAKRWPSPKASDAKKAGVATEMNRNSPSLHAQAVSGHHHPTTSTDGNDGAPRADLNPRFVASLMGVPWDWLNPCTSVATDSFHAWQQKHSPNWRLELASDAGWDTNRLREVL